MKIVVIGGTGLIGSKLVSRLSDKGHEVVAASPRTGVDTLTGKGLPEALANAHVVVDVSNSPSFEDKAVMKFFETSEKNLATAEKAAGVGHHVALSVVGTDRLPQSGYLRAKLAQEKLIEGSSIPFSILRSTQFFEFAKSIADSATDGGNVRLSSSLVQPIASDDVVAALADVVLGAPVNGILEVGGPEKLGLDEWIRRFFKATGDARRIIADPNAEYFGTTFDDTSLVAGDKARLGTVRLADWLSRSKKAA
ncbi:MAG: SDR family oxidoreductase [Polyangiaceae bacterium]|nr:SDR family oxidoreductase [Polyangiaceae bacterium]